MFFTDDHVYFKHSYFQWNLRHVYFSGHVGVPLNIQLSAIHGEGRNGQLVGGAERNDAQVAKVRHVSNISSLIFNLYMFLFFNVGC